MNKQELALQYFPDATSATAVRHLTRWIARCHPLVGIPHLAHRMVHTLILPREAGPPAPPVPGRAIRHTLTPFRKKFFRRRT